MTLTCMLGLYHLSKKLWHWVIDGVIALKVVSRPKSAPAKSAPAGAGTNEFLGDPFQTKNHKKHRPPSDIFGAKS